MVFLIELIQSVSLRHRKTETLHVLIYGKNVLGGQISTTFGVMCKDPLDLPTPVVELPNKSDGKKEQHKVEWL